jgi:hypothetical protein
MTAGAIGAQVSETAEMGVVVAGAKEVLPVSEVELVGIVWRYWEERASAC